MTTQYLVTQPFNGTVIALIEDGYVELSGYLHNNGGRDLTVEEYEMITERNVVAITGEELDAEIQAHNQRTYLDAPACRISADQFNDALCELPPAAYLNTGDFERFNMIERITGTITTQFVRYGDIHLCLSVDAANKDTWIAPADFDKALAGATDKRQAAA